MQMFTKQFQKHLMYYSFLKAKLSTKITEISIGKEKKIVVKKKKLCFWLAIISY